MEYDDVSVGSCLLMFWGSALIDWLIDCALVRDLPALMHLGLYTSPLCPMSNHGTPKALLQFQMAPKLMLLISSCSKKKEPRCTCLSEAKASNLHRMWAEVSSFTPRFLHSGLSSSPRRWRCLLRVLCPVRKPVTTLDWLLLTFWHRSFTFKF